MSARFIVANGLKQPELLKKIHRTTQNHREGSPGKVGYTGLEGKRCPFLWFPSWAGVAVGIG